LSVDFYSFGGIYHRANFTSLFECIDFGHINLPIKEVIVVVNNFENLLDFIEVFQTAVYDLVFKRQLELLHSEFDVLKPLDGTSTSRELLVTHFQLYEDKRNIVHLFRLFHRFFQL
jgi:hypothetical protein